MTEEQAKTRWCPHSRVRTGLGEVSCNRHGKEQGDTGSSLAINSNCIASDCMMWVPEIRRQHGSMTEVSGGYCGLAGKV